MKKLKELIWYEKYRQTDLDDLVLSKAHRKIFESFIDAKEIPHLLFYGPPGSGKTTIAMILIKACASADLVLNASSSDRGIMTIKTTVKNFARSTNIKKGRTNIIFFDEADGITSDAQFALKNTIEKWHKNCRFIFTANHLDKVIPEIQSRCMFFQFEQVSQKALVVYLENILDSEGVDYKEGDIVKLIDYFSYDVRTIINNMQVASIGGEFNLKSIFVTFPTKKVFKLIKKGKIREIRKMTREHSTFTSLYKALFNDFVPSLNNNKRGEIALTIAEYLWRDRAVTDREINFTACILEIMDTLDIDPEF